MKRCSLCREVKPLEAFSGKEHRCKPCCSAKTAAWLAAHPEQRRASNKAYHAKHREKLKAYGHRYYAEHREELKAKSRAWAAANATYVRETKRRYREENAALLQTRQRLAAYGLTEEEYQQLLRDQDGRCAICLRQPEPDALGRTLHVDHDHRTGVVRGLLCANCNSGIGHLRDNPALVLEAYRYLAGGQEMPAIQRGAAAFVAQA